MVLTTQLLLFTCLWIIQTAIYKQHLQATQRKDLHFDGLEGIWIHVKFPSTSALFSVMYRPPDADHFFGLVNSPLGKAWLKSSNIFLMGDFNCDFSTKGLLSVNTSKLRSIFEMFNTENVIQEATRQTLTSSSLIDLIVTTRKDLVSATGVFPLGISDHNLIYATIRLKNKRPPPKIVKTRDYKRMDIESFRHDIESTPFHIAPIFNDPDDILWAWQYLFNDICDEHAAWKKVKIRSISAPWITSDIRLKMNRRYKLFKAAVSTKCPMQWSAYKKARNKVTSELRKAKTAYFSKMFSEVQSTSAYWNLMKRATDPKARKTIGPVKRDDGTVALVDEEKACILNSYFATVGQNLASNFPPITGNRQGATSSARDDRTVPLLKEVHVSSLAIQNKIEVLNVNKSMGLDLQTAGSGDLSLIKAKKVLLLLER